MKKITLYLLIALFIESFLISTVNTKAERYTVYQPNLITELKTVNTIETVYRAYTNEEILEIEKAKKEKEEIESNKLTRIEVYLLYNSSVKSYMDMNMITSKSSPQYKYIQTHDIKVDENGMYYEMYKNKKFYCVALGSYFGDIGSKFEVELSNGNIIYIVKVDEKSNNDTIDGFIHKNDSSIIEFIINTEIALTVYPHENGYVNNGNFNNCRNFEGTISLIYEVY